MAKSGKKTKARLSIKKELLSPQKHSGGKLHSKVRARPVARARPLPRSRPRDRYPEKE
jgi:hypothetical protein